MAAVNALHRPFRRAICQIRRICFDREEFTKTKGTECDMLGVAWRGGLAELTFAISRTYT